MSTSARGPWFAIGLAGWAAGGVALFATLPSEAERPKGAQVDVRRTTHRAPSPYVALAREAARDGYALLQLAPPTLATSRFGMLEVATARLASVGRSGAPLHCLTFRAVQDGRGPTDGRLCGQVPPTLADLACALDRFPAASTTSGGRPDRAGAACGGALTIHAAEGQA